MAVDMSKKVFNSGSELCIPNITKFSSSVGEEDVVRGSKMAFCESENDELAFTAFIIVATAQRLGKQAVERYIKRVELKRLPPDVLISAARRLLVEIYDRDFGVAPASEARRLGIRPPPWPEPFVAVAPFPLVLEAGVVPMPSLQFSGRSRPGAYVERGLVLMTRTLLYEFVKSLYFIVVEKRVEPLARDLIAMYNLPNVEPEKLGLRRIVVKTRVAEGRVVNTPHGNPPCMTAILEALKRGENLPHTARFAIATYLLKRGWDVEQIVELFRNAPDFNEKITRYQVQHIAGRAGGRKEYNVPSCKTMKEWGLCVANCGIKSPLQYRG